MSSAPKFFSMEPLSVRLSQRPSDSFDVIIIGSGYGGSIAASRLARAGRRVCLLERGDEVLPGQYPTDAGSAAGQMSLVSARQGRLHPKPLDPAQTPSAVPGIMELRVGPEMHVILGTGLGGGSLVNANMSIEPDMRVFDTGWPAVFRPVPGQDGKPGRTNCLAGPYATARAALGAKKMPEALWPAKTKALKQSAEAMNQPFDAAEINVTFDNLPNHFGITQAPCTMCGDCCSGCNYGAKNTLLMNYLPDAQLHGATLVTLAEARHVTRQGSRWAVLSRDLSAAAGLAGAAPVEVTLLADIVILAAGSLGTTEILFRSQAEPGGPSLSAALGTKFSGNGDVLGFGFGANPEQITDVKDAGKITPLYSIGAGANAPTAPEFRPGPCITGVIRVDMTDSDPLQNGLVIEDGTAPGPLASAYPALMFLQDVLQADFADYPDTAIRTASLADLGQALQNSTDPQALSYSGAMAQMQSYLLMSHDPASGKLAFHPATGLVSVDWPGVGASAPYPRDNDKLREASQAIWANYIANPIWDKSFGRNVVSVHPLGGCPMADSPAEGVCDAEGRVYTGEASKAVHDGLLICDGSIIPTSLGVNPLLTISALTERAMTNLIARNGWSEDKSQNPVRPARPGTPLPAGPADIDWVRLSKRIGELDVALHAIADVCWPGFEDPVKAAVDLLVKEMFDASVVPEIDVFVTAALDAAYPHLSGDLGPAIQTFRSDLQKFKTAIDTALEQNEPVAQAAINSLFAIAGDVSPSLGFEESMQGHVWDRPEKTSHVLADAYEIAEALGRDGARVMEANFTVLAASTLAPGSKDVAADIALADLSGTVMLTNAQGRAVQYAVTEGKFSLLQPDPSQIETWLMTYDCRLVPGVVSEPVWHMTGVKTLQWRPGTEWFPQLTTLMVDLTTESAGVASKAQCGIIRLDLQDIAAQVLTTIPRFTSDVALEGLDQEVMANLKNGTFKGWIGAQANLRKLLQHLLMQSDFFGKGSWPVNLARAIEAFFVGGVAAKFGRLILRSYGGIVAYTQDFPALDQAQTPVQVLPEPGKTQIRGWNLRQYDLPAAPANPKVCLFHFEPPSGRKARFGPVILTPGMSTTALSFAVLTVERSLVDMLLEQDYDVWLFDYRASPRVVPTNLDYTLDDIAREDWPMAVDFVLRNSPLKPRDVQVVAHCVGALTGQMALLSGKLDKAKIRQLILMQFTAKVGSSWYNLVRADLGLAQAINKGFPDLALNLLRAEINDEKVWKSVESQLKNGVAKVSIPSPDPATISDFDSLLNKITWPAPFGIDAPCLSPTCHRIYASYGPIIAHHNLNQATHDGLREIFGEVATKPFAHLALILQNRQIVDSQGRDTYLGNVANLDVPIHIISGQLNQIMLPESGYLTQVWLKQSLPHSKNPVTRVTIQGYAHNDCLVGKDAHRDVFPGILEQLSLYQDPVG